LDYLPNLIVIAAVLLIVYWLVHVLGMIFAEIEKGSLKIRGFYPDWAEPTEKLVRVLVLAFTVIVLFPYLPGVKSPAFQGISIFLGVLLSLGSSSAVANAVAGVILTYMRSYLVGDWVSIGGTTGEVIEKTLLVTRVKTPKDEVITVPNATVMSGAVTNYSVEARKSGVIFHTTVTIGYNAPWRVVHRLLIDAALETEHIKSQPVPFVLQSALNDFYITYELNAFTDNPKEVLNIYSNLHRNIQDKFNEEGVEICSPHFTSLRDGNAIAVPDHYIKPGYEAPGFRIDGKRAEKADDAHLRQVSDSR
jgi:small-conductance mechanosensitive channel